jgi:hypothetical protein
MDTNWGGESYTRNIVNAATNNKAKKSDKNQKEIASRYNKEINEPIVRALQ